jgi:hypothetical protein
MALAWPVRGQVTKEEGPSAALASALVAACRQNEAQFERYQTTENAAAFRALPAEQRATFMQRIILQKEPGRPLLSNDAEGHPVVRCETTGSSAELRFGTERVRENVAFIPVDAMGGRRIEFGMVREGGAWRMLSVGLLLLNLPELAKQWGPPVAPADEIDANEAAAIVSLRRLAEAIETYQKAFGKLPERLAQLGPAKRGSVSPELANLIEAELAEGKKGGYVFDYRIVAAPPKTGESRKAAGGEADIAEKTYELTATPIVYGKSGRRSFYLDRLGTLRGGDKNGALATPEDPKIESKLESESGFRVQG